MDDSNATGFWHSHLGRYLTDAPATESSKARLPTRLKRGVDANTLGPASRPTTSLPRRNHGCTGR